MEVVGLASTALLITLYGIAGVTTIRPLDRESGGDGNRLLWIILDGGYVSLIGVLSYLLWGDTASCHKAPAVVLAAIALSNIILQFQSPTANRQYGAIWKYLDGMSIATLLLVLLGQIPRLKTGTCTSTQGPERSHHY
jgi:hypothetical protein